MMLQETSFWEVLTSKQVDILLELSQLNLAKYISTMNEFLLQKILSQSSNQSLEDV